MFFAVAGLDEPVDNGPHLFAGCYDAQLRYVDTIGADDRLLWDAPPFAIRTGADALLTPRGPEWWPLNLRRTLGPAWPPITRAGDAVWPQVGRRGEPLPRGDTRATLIGAREGPRNRAVARTLDRSARVAPPTSRRGGQGVRFLRSS